MPNEVATAASVLLISPASPPGPPETLLVDNTSARLFTTIYPGCSDV